MTSVAVLERLTRVTPLGVRFRDAATGGFVTSGLSVDAFPDGLDELRTAAIVNRASVFVFRHLPGLSEVERGRGDAAYWAAETPRYPFVLELRDREERFLPYKVSVLLPCRRLFGLAFNSPLSSPLAAQAPSSSQFLPLFSSPSRLVPDAMAVVRAEIVDSTTNEPAAWAILEAKGPGQAMAGRVGGCRWTRDGAALVPKPVVTLGSPGSPPMPLTGQTWTIDFTVRYRRRVPVAAVPDLVDVLTQPAATSWQDVARTTPLTQATLRFGRDLVLGSLTGAVTPSAPLLISPAGSPP